MSMSILLILPLVLFSVCYRFAVNKDLYKNADDTLMHEIHETVNYESNTTDCEGYEVSDSIVSPSTLCVVALTDSIKSSIKIS